MRQKKLASREEIKKVVEKFMKTAYGHPDVSDFEEDEKIAQYLDSLEELMLLQKVEQKFQMSIPDSEAEKSIAGTIGDFIDFVFETQEKFSR